MTSGSGCAGVRIAAEAVTEQQPYEVLRRYAGFEVGRYPPCTVAEAGMTPLGPPRFARFDPLFMPWFLRHNAWCVTAFLPFREW